MTAIITMLFLIMWFIYIGINAIVDRLKSIETILKTIQKTHQ